MVKTCRYRIPFHVVQPFLNERHVIGLVQKDMLDCLEAGGIISVKRDTVHGRDCCVDL